MYFIQYRVVWCVKYRQKVLMVDIDIRVKGILHRIQKKSNPIVYNEVQKWKYSDY
ncbi:transposase [Bacillus andreraoultii]|uniref:transposase n=1 Tax=Bacillus andreraoultii TaxID=1499685 RepID=UPI000B1751F4